VDAVSQQSRAGYAELSLSPRLLDRYIAREFLVGYVIATSVVLSLRVIIDLFVMFDEFIEAKVGQATPSALTVFGYILDYYGPKMFEYFRDFSGTMIILAAAFSLARMRRQNELTAVLASGISLKRFIAPIVLLAFGLNLLMVIDQEVVLPRMANKLVRYHDEMGQLRSLSFWLMPDKIKYLKGASQPYLDRQVAQAGEDALLSAGSYDSAAKTMLRLVVILRREGQMVGRINAETAQWDSDQQDWVLSEGYYFSYDNSGRVGRANVAAVDRYRSDLTAEYLYLQRNKDFKGLMSSSELTDLLGRQLQPAERAEAISEKHFRFADPIINMVMLLLALPMIVSREKRSTKVAMLLAFVGAGGCFLTVFACKLLAGGMLQPLLAAWLPIIVFVPLSVIALDGLKT